MRQHTMVVTIGLVLTLVVLLVVVALPGPGDRDQPEPPPEPSEAVRTGHLLAGLPSHPDALDPHLATSDTAFVALDQIHDTLVRLGEDLLPQPALADSWEVSDDGLTWTFALRDDVRFHDGSPLTSADVVASLERVAGDGVDAVHLDIVDGIEAPDPYTVTIHLGRPTPGLATRLGSTGTAIVPADHAVSDTPTGEPIGTGPFRLVDTDDATVELERLEDHWGGAPRLEGIGFRVVADADEALAALRAGDLDWVATVPPGRAGEVAADGSLHLARVVGLEYWFLAFNLDRQPFGDVAVRRAVAFALDRDAIAEAARPGGATPAQTPLPPDVFWRHDHAPFEHDPERARELLTDAGLDDASLELLVTDELAASAPVADAIGGQLADVGIEVRVRTEALENLLAAQAEGDFDAFVLGWRGESDPDDLYRPPHHSEGSRNFQGFVDEKVNELLDAARAANQPAARKALYDDAVKRIVDRVPYAYLFNTDVLRAWSVDLQGIDLGPEGRVRFARAHLER